MGKNCTNIYVVIPEEDNLFVDSLRLAKIKQDRRPYTKNEIVADLIAIGIDYHKGRLVRPSPEIDSFVSKIQNMVIEFQGQKMTVKKSKEQVYSMLLEKGIEHLNCKNG